MHGNFWFSRFLRFWSCAIFGTTKSIFATRYFGILGFSRSTQSQRNAMQCNATKECGWPNERTERTNQASNNSASTVEFMYSNILTDHYSSGTLRQSSKFLLFQIQSIPYNCEKSFPNQPDCTVFFIQIIHIWKKTFAICHK